MPIHQPAGERDSLHRLHERPQDDLHRWLTAPAHIHHMAHRLAHPPSDRPRSREEFLHLLQGLGIASETSVVHEKFGFGARTEPDGERLIVIWQAHTEYYSYQIWHIPSQASKPLCFGPLTFPQYAFPLSPLGMPVNALDLLIVGEREVGTEQIPALLPGPTVYGSRVFGTDLSILTNFTPDEHGRERYLIVAASLPPSPLVQLLDAIVKIETYYHLILMQKPKFAAAVDDVYRFEQLHLRQRQLITAQLQAADAGMLQRWLNGLTEDLMKVNRLAGALQYDLSAAVPYDKIVHTALASIQEQALSPYRPLSDYVLGGVTGVADGYQQLL